MPRGRPQCDVISSVSAHLAGPQSPSSPSTGRFGIFRWGSGAKDKTEVLDDASANGGGSVSPTALAAPEPAGPASGGGGGGTTTSRFSIFARKESAKDVSSHALRSERSSTPPCPGALPFLDTLNVSEGGGGGGSGGGALGSRGTPPKGRSRSAFSRGNEVRASFPTPLLASRSLRPALCTPLFEVTRCRCFALLSTGGRTRSRRVPGNGARLYFSTANGSLRQLFIARTV